MFWWYLTSLASDLTTNLSHGQVQVTKSGNHCVSVWSVDPAAKQIWILFCNNWALFGNQIPSNLTQVFGCPPKRWVGGSGKVGAGLITKSFTLSLSPHLSLYPYITSWNKILAKKKFYIIEPNTNTHTHTMTNINTNNNRFIEPPWKLQAAISEHLVICFFSICLFVFYLLICLFVLLSFVFLSLVFFVFLSFCLSLALMGICIRTSWASRAARALSRLTNCAELTAKTDT